VLINITAASNLGIHEVDEACRLICDSTQNNDVQINFGVVLDEKMGDKVKVTVIATGFQRDTLPEADRRNPHFPFSITNAPDFAASTASTSESMPEAAAPFFEPRPEPQPEPASVRQDESSSMPDYEVPAYLRKQRRLVQ
jgi:cell division protein FtsZ